MTKACHQLFQENKNPSDSEIEEAFKSQIQKDCPKKMQELINSNGWENLWNAAYSIVCYFFLKKESFFLFQVKINRIYTILFYIFSQYVYRH